MYCKLGLVSCPSLFCLTNRPPYVVRFSSAPTSTDRRGQYRGSRIHIIISNCFLLYNKIFLHRRLFESMGGEYDGRKQHHILPGPTIPNGGTGHTAPEHCKCSTLYFHIIGYGNGKAPCIIHESARNGDIIFQIRGYFSKCRNSSPGIRICITVSVISSPTTDQVITPIERSFRNAANINTCICGRRCWCRLGCWWGNHGKTQITSKLNRLAHVHWKYFPDLH